MGKATLTYTILYDSNGRIKTLNLETGSLFYIDECTRLYDSQIALKNSYIYRNRISEFLNKHNSNNGSFSVEYVKNNELKEKIPILIDDKQPIFNHDNLYEDQKSEVEKSRKLLFNSKNKMFLKAFLKCNKFIKTVDFNISVSYNEYLEGKKRNIKGNNLNGEYYLNIYELLNNFSNSEKMGSLRPVVEDALEIWKKNMLDYSEEGLYYYSRNLRILINEYYKVLKSKKVIKNLNTNSKTINRVFKNNLSNYENDVATAIIIDKSKKQKILLDKIA